MALALSATTSEKPSSVASARRLWDGSNFVHAIEPGKTRRYRAEDREPLEKFVAGTDDASAAFARWLMAMSGRDRNLQQLVALVASSDAMAACEQHALSHARSGRICRRIARRGSRLRAARLARAGLLAECRGPSRRSDAPRHRERGNRDVPAAGKAQRKDGLRRQLRRAATAPTWTCWPKNLTALEPMRGSVPPTARCDCFILRREPNGNARVCSTCGAAQGVSFDYSLNVAGEPQPGMRRRPRRWHGRTPLKTSANERRCRVSDRLASAR